MSLPNCRPCQRSATPLRNETNQNRSRCCSCFRRALPSQTRSSSACWPSATRPVPCGRRRRRPRCVGAAGHPLWGSTGSCVRAAAAAAAGALPASAPHSSRHARAVLPWEVAQAHEWAAFVDMFISRRRIMLDYLTAGIQQSACPGSCAKCQPLSSSSFSSNCRDAHRAPSTARG